MKNFKSAVEKLAFQKEDTQSLGLLLKSIFLRQDLNKPSAKFQGSIFEEFDISEGQLDKNLKRCIELWKRVTNVVKILHKSGGLGDELVTQFDTADKFFTKKINAIGKGDMLEEDI